jgi:hypothetical protein
MGVTINEEGDPVIVAAPCPNERVVALELVDPSSVLEGTPIPDWRVRSRHAAEGGLYMVPINNDPPPGFYLVDSLAESLPMNVTLLANVRTRTNEGDPGGAAREFRIEDLQIGQVLARGGQLISMEEFLTSARDAC